MSKYALVERERRFLVDHLPAGTGPGYRIEDRYLRDVRLRLRRMEGPEGVRFKLTQKISRGPSDNLITNIYLSEEEYRHLRSLPGQDLYKSRHRFMDGATLWSIDIFGPPCEGLILAETELEGDAEVRLSSFLGQEVTADERYQGGNLAWRGLP